MTIGANFDDKIHANLCAAIKSLSPENKFAFAPFLSAEEHNFMGEAIVHNEYSNDVLGSITGLLTGNDSQYKTHLDELAKSFDSKENSGHDATSATASLIMNLTHKVISQISECLDIPINKLTKAFPKYPHIKNSKLLNLSNAKFLTFTFIHNNKESSIEIPFVYLLQGLNIIEN